MIFLTKPGPSSMRQFLARQTTVPFSYAEVGATNGMLPPGYSINHIRKQLGKGQSVFDSACEALQSWQQLQLGWVDCWPHNAPLRAGANIAVIGRGLGLWWLNACRVVYTIDDRDREARFGYAHGTLPQHLASGEERFLIELSPNEDVWIDILAFSRPNTAVARLGYPLMRHCQNRFGKESVRKMQLIVERASFSAPHSRSERPPSVAVTE